MPRSKITEIYTYAATNRRAALAERKRSVNTVILHANRARRGDTSESWAKALDLILTAFTQGRFEIGVPSHLLNVTLAVGLVNIGEAIRTKHRHLRICDHCRLWMFYRHGRRETCRDCQTLHKTKKRQDQRDARHALDEGTPTPTIRRRRRRQGTD
jgi:hypothetical protein